MEQGKNSEPPNESAKENGGAPPAKSGGNLLEQSSRAFQKSVVESAPIAAASYSLIGAIVFCGGLGYLIDRWQGTAPGFLVGGLFLGVVVGFYQLVKVVSRQ